MPADTEVPEAVKSTYKWIEGLSVTEMEIMHGAYRKDNPNGMLYMVVQKVTVLRLFMTYRVPMVRESRGILRESGKVRENREGQGKVREF